MISVQLTNVVCGPFTRIISTSGKKALSANSTPTSVTTPGGTKKRINIALTCNKYQSVHEHSTTVQVSEKHSIAVLHRNERNCRKSFFFLLMLSLVLVFVVPFILLGKKGKKVMHSMLNLASKQ